MMRVSAGGHVITSSSGVEVHVDQPLSTEQVDVLVAAIELAGETPDSTTAVELSEAGVIVEYFVRDDDGSFVVDRLLEQHATRRKRLG